MKNCLHLTKNQTFDKKTLFESINKRVTLRKYRESDNELFLNFLPSHFRDIFFTNEFIKSNIFKHRKQRRREVCCIKVLKYPQK